MRTSIGNHPNVRNNVTVETSRLSFTFKITLAYCFIIGPLEDNAGNKITQGILMAEELNMHFSSVFTREDTSSLPVPETKFEGSEWNGWGS